MVSGLQPSLDADLKEARSGCSGVRISQFFLGGRSPRAAHPSSARPRAAGKRPPVSAVPPHARPRPTLGPVTEPPARTVTPRHLPGGMYCTFFFFFNPGFMSNTPSLVLAAGTTWGARYTGGMRMTIEVPLKGARMPAIAVPAGHPGHRHRRRALAQVGVALIPVPGVTVPGVTVPDARHRSPRGHPGNRHSTQSSGSLQVGAGVGLKPDLPSNVSAPGCRCPGCHCVLGVSVLGVTCCS